MLSSEPNYLPPDDRDQEIFEATVPEDHYLRRVKDVIDFERFRPILAEAYCNDQGRPAIEPLLLLKLEFLQYQYNHSDRQVMMHACSNMAYRHFLDLSLHSSLPHHTLLTYFRQRLGTQRHQQIFDAMVGQARERGLVKDRLRLKDATHVLANIAIPTTIALVAQTRERLLQALEPWAADEVSCQRQRAEQIRQRTEDLSGAERLLERVVHLRELVAWAEVVCSRDEFRAALPLQQPQLQDALELARKVLEGRAGYQGAVLQTLTDAEGVNVEVFTPPRKSVCPHEIKPEHFILSEDKQTLSCPGGQTTNARRYHEKGEGLAFSFFARGLRRLS